jgi:hypothetical protein
VFDLSMGFFGFNLGGIMILMALMKELSLVKVWF